MTECPVQTAYVNDEKVQWAKKEHWPASVILFAEAVDRSLDSTSLILWKAFPEPEGWFSPLLRPWGVDSVGSLLLSQLLSTSHKGQHRHTPGPQLDISPDTDGTVRPVVYFFFVWKTSKLIYYLFFINSFWWCGTIAVFISIRPCPNETGPKIGWVHSWISLLG